MMTEAEKTTEKLFMVGCIMVFILTLGLALEPVEEVKQDNVIYGLTIPQTKALAYQLGLDGYKIAIKDKCMGEIARRLNTGKWNNDICQYNYQHIKFEEL